eukprot:TRINITY_DN6205_c0_g1_i1.p1 TRINITY_DN6205_c0_g1~~TRINITY_DN6205_c0_g1_i1.p1  ORF type:complete len:327 (+),score=39.64 TRINITY_DN6205_c0_g1_i1:39-983(+)
MHLQSFCMFIILIIMVLLKVAVGETITVGQEYDPQRAAFLMHHSSIVYCSQSIIQEWSCPACAKTAKPSSIIFLSYAPLNTFGYVAIYNETIPTQVLVVFRGTDPLNMKDYLNDLNLGHRKTYGCPNCWVHEGFANCYDHIHPSVTSTLALIARAYPKNEIHITGHSLGGALARLCAIALSRLGIVGTSIYTFGEPRVGNQEFVDFSIHQVASILRIIHWADPVPHLPPSLLQFKHSPQEIWYDLASKTYKTCSASQGEDPSCSNSLLIPLELTDHFTYLGWDFLDNFFKCYRKDLESVNLPPNATAKDMHVAV